MNRQDARTCKSVQSQLVAYAHGELGRSERAQVGNHVRRCESCAQALVTQMRIEEQLREGLAASAERHRPSGQSWERLQRQIAPRPQPGPLRMSFAALSTATAGLLATALMLSQFASIGLREMLRPGDITVVPESGAQLVGLDVANIETPARGIPKVTRVNPAELGDRGLPVNTERIDMQMLLSLFAWSPIPGELDALSTTRPCASCIKLAPPAKPLRRTRRVMYIVYTFDDRVPKGYCALDFLCVQAA
jgi:hypothetical protein